MTGRRLLWTLLAVYLVALGYLTLGPAPIGAIDTGERVVTDVRTHLPRPDPATNAPERRNRRRDRVDTALNIALFVPLGGLLVALFPGLAWRVVVIGAAVSVAIEIVQPWIGRSRQFSDVVANTTGAALGWAAVTGARLFPRTRPARGSPPVDHHP